MARGIIIFGASGSGTTTLGKAVATSLGFSHFDLDDYLWRWDTAVPFTVFRPREERIKLLMDDISNGANFVMSGSMDSYNAPFVPLFDLAVFCSTPTNLRVKRIISRETARFGERILPGGDMYEVHQNFLSTVRRYDTDDAPPCRKVHEEWIITLPCPVLRIDGALPVTDNVHKIAKRYDDIKQKAQD